MNKRQRRSVGIDGPWYRWRAAAMSTSCRANEESVDYKARGAAPLSIPPDLTQANNDPR